MIDKDFCASSYLAFRYIEKDNVDFYGGLEHKYILPVQPDTFVKDENDIDDAIAKVFVNLQNEKLGIMLSGGMDSACLASYMPKGSDAYTFRFLDGSMEQEELARAEYYANKYKLNLHYVDISFDDVINFLPIVMKAKNAPVHSIEPQIYKAAIQAKADGITTMIIGESADLIFGGMDKLLAKDWSFEEFKNRYIFTKPETALANPVNVDYLFERYRKGDKIDFLSFMDDVFSIESSSSYFNAFGAAGMKYVDPYAKMKMSEVLDLNRVRNGEPKYLIRALFHKKYTEMKIPDKNPMPRPVDIYFKNWEGPKRAEFKPNLDISQFTGNQKWQLYCLEKFFDIYEPIK